MANWINGSEIASGILDGAASAYIDANTFELVLESGQNFVSLYLNYLKGDTTSLELRVGVRLFPTGEIYWKTYTTGSTALHIREFTTDIEGGQTIDIGLNQSDLHLIVQVKQTGWVANDGSYTLRAHFSTGRSTY